MSVRRFVAASSREAMRLVRAALGEDALILSNRSTAEGVEILALAEDDQQQLAAAAAPEASPPRVAPPAPAATPAAALGYHQASSLAAYAAQAPRPVEPSASAIDFAALSERLLGEMQNMRALLDRQMQAPAAAGRQAQLQQSLLGAGFGPRLCGEILTGLPAEMAAGTAAAPELQAWLERQLAARLPVQADESELLDGGGVIALVGPTGVGKTTTTAKLAARYVMRHGGSQVALVTTDSFRIGAHEQLRIYARLLGVEVHALAADAPLDALLADLAGKRLVIIDTVGMSQRDRRLLTQIHQLGAAGRPVRLMLLLNAASHGDTLEEVVDTYQRAALAAGVRLADCIVSKCDEAARLGPVLDILIRRRLRLHYLSTGQQVPEDLQPAAASALVQQALAVSQPSPFVPEQSSAAGGSQRLDVWARGLLGQGRRLTMALASLRREVEDFALLESAWSLTALPASVQGQRLAELLAAHGAAPSAGGPRQLLWGRGKPLAGATWNMPLLTLDAGGRLQLRPWLSHLLPVGQERRLQWAGECLQAHRHLLPACPDGETREQLARLHSPWLCPVKGSSRVEYQRERYSLAQLAEVSERHGSLALRHRGRSLRLELQRLPVQLRGGFGQPLQAWFGELREADNGQSLGLRHWLAWSPQPGRAAFDEQAEGLRLQLACDDLPALTLRAWQALGEVHGPLQTELRLFLAAALAACAHRLEQAAEDWAMDVRAQLLGLTPGRRQRGPGHQLDALLHLLAAGDAFRQLGAIGGLA